METRIHLILLLIAIVPTMSQEWQVDPDTCGRQYAGMSSMIVGGNKADEFEWPWQAAMYRGGRRSCGGSVIAPYWVITAAHCVSVIFEPSIFEFRAGSKSLTNTTKATQRQTAVEVYVHPGYDPSTYDNDIALFKMDRPFNMWADFEINTVCLPKKAMEVDFPPGKDSVVTGWGALVQGGGTPDELYEVTVPIYNQTACNTSYEGGITDNMICAGVPEGGIDSCQGDSGGPMVSLHDGQYYLVGIVSWGRGCAQEGYPGVYTRVTEYEEWIAPIFNKGIPTYMDGTCDADEFLCRGGECINDEYRCSGSGQCYHDTDEQFCNGLLKMFDVFYFERINPDDVERTDEDMASTNECAEICLEIGCRAFDATPTGTNFTCDFAMANFTTVPEENTADRTFNHFELQTQEPGSVFNQAAGIIASPSYFSTPMPGSVHYSWTIDVGFTADTLTFRILSVGGSSMCEELDNNYALLSISGGNGIERTSFCLGAEVEGAEFVVRTVDAVVELVTTNASTYTFLLEYESSYDCNREYTIGPGVVMSPNYPSEYPNNVRCSTHLQAPEGEVVMFEFDVMSVEYHPSCNYDWVGLYDGADWNAPLVGYYCGDVVPKTQFQSSGRDMFIYFSSDSSVNATGFKASFMFKVDREATEDPNIAYISSLEGELSGFKYGIAAACVIGTLLVIVLSVSLYTVNKRDAMNAELVAQLTPEEVDDDDKPGYNRIEDDNVEEGPYSNIDSVDGITQESQGTQASKVMIANETGYVNHNVGAATSSGKKDIEFGGVENQGFVQDEKRAEEAAAVAAVFDAVSEGEVIESKGEAGQTVVVTADVTPLPKDDEEQAFPLPPFVETAPPAPFQDDDIPPPPEVTPPPPPPADDVTASPTTLDEGGDATAADGNTKM